MSTHEGITKLGIVADTHMPEAGTLPLRLFSELEKVDVIIHLGDFSDVKTFKEFQKIAPVVAVYGNADDDELRTLLPEKKKLEVNGYTLGLIHGWGPPLNLEKRVAKVFTDVDIILFGHSHVPLAMHIEHKLVFNPGSPLLNQDSTGTFGILELGETISHQIIRLDS
ncbi:MAG: metallophosphoesterase family protein [bacterium]|jgi:putative phosphoesterase